MVNFMVNFIVMYLFVVKVEFLVYVLVKPVVIVLVKFMVSTWIWAFKKA